MTKSKHKTNNMLSLLINPISTTSMFLGILGCVIAMIPIILLINNYAYENGKLVCDNYVLNSYLYALLGFCIIGISVFFEQKFRMMHVVFGQPLLIVILLLITYLAVFFVTVYYIINTNPKHFFTIHLAYFLACFMFGLLLSMILVLGYAIGVLYQAILITIGITIVMAFIGYKYGHLFITVDFDKYLRYSLVALIIWSLLAQLFISDPFTLILSISIPSVIVFSLLLMSFNNQLRKNQKTCVVPNYPNEAIGLVIKIGNILSDVIRLLLVSRARR
jgi:hypothetical protein